MTDLHLFLSHGDIKPWPKNIRRTYRPADVEAMAESQRERAARGQPPCVHSIIVTPGPGVAVQPVSAYVTKAIKRNPLYLVAGHLRHAGNAHLGKHAPNLNCTVRYYANEAAMLADMRTENGQRVDLSPLEWARHFEAELAAGVSEHTLLGQSGKNSNYFHNCLNLLKLAPEVQTIIDAGDLALGAVKELLEVEDPKAQVQIARRMRGFTVAKVGKAVTLYLQRKAIKRKAKLPAPAGSKQAAKPVRPATDGLPAHTSATAADLRLSAAHACQHCDVGRNLRSPEPAWHIALAAAGEVCDGCDLKQVRNACAGCPLSEMMSHLARAHGVATTAPAPVHA